MCFVCVLSVFDIDDMVGSNNWPCRTNIWIGSRVLIGNIPFKKDLVAKDSHCGTNQLLAEREPTVELGGQR